MSTPREVAEWMAKHFETSNRLYQETTVLKIKREFGDDFVYRNENGNWAIGKNVLKEFRALTDGKLVWERGERAWRKLHPTESIKGRQVD